MTSTGRIARAFAAGLFLAAAASAGRAAEEGGSAPEGKDSSLPKGKIIEKVVALHDGEQSYALYLPSGYDPKRKWPILYGFSPGARGRNPVWLFKPAAEKYGWIVVGSNNSRNGPWEPIAKAVEAVLKDTEARLSIDKSRRYTTGFSGGARVGFHLAARDKFAGTIPVGGGMGRGQKPPGKGGLVVYSMCGRRCFNHGELLRLERQLRAAGVRNRMATFDGEHQWAPRDMCGAALRYMELLWQLEKKGAKDESVVAILDLELADAGKLLKTKGQYMRGHERLCELAGFGENESISARLAEVEASEKYKREKALAEKVAKIRTEAAEIADADRRFEETVKRYMKFVSDHPESEAAARVKVTLQSTAQQMAMGGAILMRRKDYRRAETYLKRARLFAPADKNLAYNLACAQARNGKKEEAIRTLAESVKLGFTDFDHIKKDPDLEPLREDEDFAAILETLSGKDGGTAEGGGDDGGGE
ncbi:MAG: TPR end-of-group domain-containing protein [Planctomycetota bacterium]|jgi:tetratricopeptide (TPR) repeat protein